MKNIIFVFIVIWFILLFINEVKKLLTLLKEKKELVKKHNEDVKLLKDNIKNYRKNLNELSRELYPDEIILTSIYDNYKVAHLKYVLSNSSIINDLKINILRRFKSMVCISVYLLIICTVIAYLYFF